VLIRTLTAARTVITRALYGAAAAGAARRTGGTAPCRCGHGRDAHMHYRRGSDCALCECPRWSPARRPRLTGR